MANMEGTRRLLCAALLGVAGMAVTGDSPGQDGRSAQPAPTFSTATDPAPGDAGHGGVSPVVLLDEGASMITITAPGLASAVPGLADLSAALYPPDAGNATAPRRVGEPGAPSGYIPVRPAGAAPSSSPGRFAPSWAMCLSGLALLAVGWRVRSSGPAVPATT